MQYKQLINALEHGFHVLVTAHNKYLVISPIKDEDGCWRDSSTFSTPEKAKQSIGDYKGYSQKELQVYCPDWELVEVFTIPYKHWKEGDEVMIADNTKELCEKAGFGWNEEMQEMQEMVGKKCEVKNWFSLGYWVWNEDKSDYWLFPHEALLPVFDEEEYEEVTIRVSKKSLKALKESGIKIIK